MRWLSRAKPVSKPLFISILGLFSFSCSLKYSETVNSEDRVPEFVFEETKLVRYEDMTPRLEVSAGTLEQYKNTNETYGKDIAFISYDKEGKTETEGSCGVIFADTGRKLYELYDDINVYNTPEKMRFYANVLKWDGRSEQLTSGRSDMVKIEKDDTIMRGTGFSASGLSKKFSFRGNITGTIETKDEKEEGVENPENQDAAKQSVNVE
jgi:LPS export ABC transporter protein LptC